MHGFPNKKIPFRYDAILLVLMILFCQNSDLENCFRPEVPNLAKLLNGNDDILLERYALTWESFR